MQTLTITAEVTADFLAAIELNIRDVLYARLLEKHRLYKQGYCYQKVRPLAFIAVMILSILLLMITVLSFFVGSNNSHSLMLNLFFMLAALCGFYFYRNRDKNDMRIERFNQYCWRWAAKVRANTMLKIAKKRHLIGPSTICVVTCCYTFV